MTSYKAARMASTDCTSAGRGVRRAGGAGGGSTDCTSAGLAFGQSGCAAMEPGIGALAVCASTRRGRVGITKQRRAVRAKDVRVMRGKVTQAAWKRRMVLRQQRPLAAR